MRTSQQVPQLPRSRSGPQRGIGRRVVDIVGRMVPAFLLRRSPRRVRALLVRAVNAGLREHPKSFLVTTEAGFRFRGTTRDIIQRYVYLFRVWEPSIARYLASHVSAGDMVVDAGANSGYHTLLLSQSVGPSGRVYAFEPAPSALANLRNNLALNGIKNVHVIEAAAGAESGQCLTLFLGPDENSGKSSTWASPGTVESVEVPVMTIDEVVPESCHGSVSLLKIDVEGDELAVLQGARSVLYLMPPGSAVVVEVTPDKMAARGHSADELVALLGMHGFTPFLLWNSYEPRDYALGCVRNPQPLTALTFRSGDLLFVKD